MALNMLESLHFVNGLPPVADAFAADPNADVVNMKNYNKALFVIQKGVGTTGTGLVTVLACDDTTPSNTTAIPFRYRNITSGDTPGAITEATSAGFTFTAGSNHLIAVEVDAVEVEKAGYGYVTLNVTEDTDDPVLAGILCILGEPRYSTDSTTTAIT